MVAGLDGLASVDEPTLDRVPAIPSRRRCRSSDPGGEVECMYRTIDAAFWTDPKVRRLNSSGKLLLLYLITNPHTHVSGIYYLPRVLMERETGIPHKTVDTLCDRVSKLGICEFDSDKDVVWVKNMMRFQGRGEKNTRSAAHHIMEDLHYSVLIAHFLEFYPEVKKMVPDSVSDRVSDRVSSSETSMPLLIPDSRSLNPDTRILNTDIQKTAYGRFANVFLSDDEHNELFRRFNGTLETKIEALSEYMASKGKKYTNHYATILAWERKNGNGQRGNGVERESYYERTIRKNREAAERVNQLLSGAAGADAGASHAREPHSPVLPRPKRSD